MDPVLDAPVLFQLTPGSGSVTLNFYLPDGSAFTDVLYSTNGGNFLSLGATAGPVTITKESDGVTNLVNGHVYIINLAGVSITYPYDENTLISLSQLFIPVGVATSPDAPAIGGYQPGDGSITINYALGDNGGSAVTGVYYTTDQGATWLSTGSTNGTALILTESDGSTLLVNGTTYVIYIVSVTAAAPNPQDNAQSNAIVATPAAGAVPADPPTIESYEPGDAQLNVIYKLGSLGGSDPISVYYSTDDGSTWKDSGASTGIAQITTKSDDTGPLVNGDVYQVRLLLTTTAYPDVSPNVNSPSDRVDMTPSATIVAPGAPTLGPWEAGDQMFTVSYQLGSNGGSPVLKVYYSTDDGQTWYDTGSINGLAIIYYLSSDGSTPLTNGEMYPVRLVSTTVNFTDQTLNPRSTPAITMVPGSSVIRPAPVSIDNVEIGDARLGVSYSLEYTGGSQLVDIYYSTDGGQSYIASGSTTGYFVITTSSTTGSPLDNGKIYYLMLVAATVVYPDYLNNPYANAVVSATPVADGTPPTSPSAPEITSISIGDKTITLTYKIPTDGGSAITDVLYTTNGGENWYSTGESYPFGTAVITTLSTNGSTLLSNGTTYFVQLVAITEAFPTSSNPASIIEYLTPSASSTNPDAPTITSTSPGDATIQIEYRLGSDGGSPIINVLYTTNEGADWLSTGNTSGVAILTTDSTGNPLVNDTPYVIRLVAISVDYTDPNANPQSDVVTLTPTTETSIPPDAPIIISTTPGDGLAEVFFNIESVGSGVLLSIFYSTDGNTWVDSGVTYGSFIMTTDSNGNPLVNDQEYSVRIVATTSTYPNPAANTPSDVALVTPFAGPAMPPAPPSIIEWTPGDQTLTVRYKLASNQGSFFTNLWYSTNNGSDWAILNVVGPVPTSTFAIITTVSDSSDPLTNGVTYPIQLMATSAAFPTPTNDPSQVVYMIPSATTVRPSAPVITSWLGLDGALVVRYTIPSDGGSPVTVVYYSTDGGLSWERSRAPNGTAVITMTSGGSGPIVDSTTYGVRLLAVTVDFPSLSNPSSPTVYMVARPTLPGTFKPKGMSYTEFLRSKKADRVKILNTKPVRTASEITNARRLAASNVFALNNEAVKGSITTPIDFSQGGLHAARSYFKQGGAGRRVGSASEFTAFSGSQAIGGVAQGPASPARILQPSNFVLVSPPVAKSASDFVRDSQTCCNNLESDHHDPSVMTLPVFVDNTIRNTGSPACVTRPAIHDIKAKNAFAYVPNRPSQAGGQYALKGDLEPGKDLGALGGNPHYKAGAALKNIPYVEKHHGNDLGVNPKRPFVRYQIPGGVIPTHLKANKPVTTLRCPTGHTRDPVLTYAIPNFSDAVLTVTVTGEPATWQAVVTTASPCSLNGTYFASGSHFYSGNYTDYGPQLAFERFQPSGNSGWLSRTASNNYAADGHYLGSTTTTISSTPVSGEWLQITAPQPFVLNSYTIVSGNGGARPIRSWVIAGSNNGGTTFTTVDTRSNVAMPGLTTTISGLTGLQPYSTYRIVVTYISTGSGAYGANIDAFNLFTLTP